MLQLTMLYISYTHISDLSPELCEPYLTKQHSNGKMYTTGQYVIVLLIGILQKNWHWLHLPPPEIIQDIKKCVTENGTIESGTYSPLKFPLML